MNVEIAQLIHFALLTSFATLAMQRDISAFTIPNRLTGSMAVTGVFSMILLGPSQNFQLLPLLLALGVLLCGWVMFSLGLWGAGDAKLMAAASLWISPSAMGAYALGIVLTGSVLALATLLFGLAKAARAVPGGRSRPRLLMRRLSVPYGVAIGSAAVLTLAWQIASTN